MIASLIAIADPMVAAAQSCRIEQATTHARASVIELYTSEGCSSCPPADRWLASLDSGPGLAALAFHVDYWDELGWPDRFADARYGARQSWRAQLARARTVYTPQVVLEGSDWRDWSRQREPAPASPASFGLSVQATVGTDVAVAWHSAEPVDHDIQVFAALTENDLRSLPAAGENRGTRLEHAHVVRAFATPVPFAQGSTRLTLPADLVHRNAQLVLVAENRKTGVPVHALVLTMARCVAP